MLEDELRNQALMTYFRVAWSIIRLEVLLQVESFGHPQSILRVNGLTLSLPAPESLFTADKPETWAARFQNESGNLSTLIFPIYSLTPPDFPANVKFDALNLDCQLDSLFCTTSQLETSRLPNQLQTIGVSDLITYKAYQTWYTHHLKPNLPFLSKDSQMRIMMRWHVSCMYRVTQWLDVDDSSGRRGSQVMLRALKSLGPNWFKKSEVRRSLVHAGHVLCFTRLGYQAVPNTLWHIAVAHLVFRATTFCYLYSISAAASPSAAVFTEPTLIVEERNFENLDLFGIDFSQDGMVEMNPLRNFILHGKQLTIGFKVKLIKCIKGGPCCLYPGDADLSSISGRTQMLAATSAFIGSLGPNGGPWAEIFRSIIEIWKSVPFP